MSQFVCCGIKNYTDFDGSPFNTKGDIYPQYCCNKTTTVFPCDAQEAENSVQHFCLQFPLLPLPEIKRYVWLCFMEMIDGCFDKLVAAIEENSLIIAGVAIGITAIEVRPTLVRP